MAAHSKFLLGAEIQKKELEKTSCEEPSNDSLPPSTNFKMAAFFLSCHLPELFLGPLISLSHKQSWPRYSTHNYLWTQFFLARGRQGCGLVLH